MAIDFEAEYGPRYEEEPMQNAIVEIMGRDRIAGVISQEPFAGLTMLAVDVPEIPPLPEKNEGDYYYQPFAGRPAFRKMFSGAAIFSVLHCSEADALADEINRLWREGEWRHKDRVPVPGADDPFGNAYDPFAHEDDEDDAMLPE